MLEFYVGSDSKLRHLRQCPLGKHMEGGHLALDRRQARDSAPFIKRFSDWMCHHRGMTESQLYALGEGVRCIAWRRSRHL